MLHPIPDSPLRDALLKLVDIQRTLVEKLCALPKGSTVTLEWLKADVWPPPVDPDWVDDFWANNRVDVSGGKRVGRRELWMTTIANAESGPKQELLARMNEQLRFAELYHTPPAFRLEKTDKAYWDATDFRKAAKHLLNDFYTHCLDAAKGCPGAMLECAVTVTRREYLKGATPIICPYCDTSLQKVEVDHFLPKSSFPFLSVHPDNFVPSCHDSNEVTSHKGDHVPLDWNEGDQAARYFHPRLRSANGRYSLSFRDQGRQLVLSLVAEERAEQGRVDNLDSMFKITREFWGKALESQVQSVVEEAAEYIRNNGLYADRASIQKYLLDQSATYRRYIGRRPLQILLAYLYDFVAHDDELIGNTLLRI
jgi:hypothetical protein